jgi:hypothetical protein
MEDVTQAYSNADLVSLMQMLLTRRPADSLAEEAFIEKYIEPLGVEYDGFGNLFKLIPGEGEDIMWSCHTDTVHDKGGTQAIVKKNDIISLNTKGKSNCLGADDTAGIWLMIEMIKAGKPGLYAFHRCEEVGGLGSDYVATHDQGRLSGIRAAIALDRKGYNSIITHQGERCCSDDFAWSLAEGLGMEFRPDDTGTFTDTANYIRLIPECTNLSVGYFRQHTKRETLDVAFLTGLLQALLALDTRLLVIARDPTIVDDPWWSQEAYKDPNVYDYSWHEGADYVARKPSSGDEFYDESELLHMIRLIEDNPVETARFIREMGANIDDFRETVKYYRGLTHG